MKLPAKLLALSVILTAISFCVLNIAGPIFSVLIQGIVFIVFGYAVITASKEPIYILPNIFVWWLLMIVIASVISLLSPYYAINKAFLDVKELSVPFVICFSSYYLYRLNALNLRKSLKPILFIGLICATTIIFTTGGLEIVTIYRTGVSKNQTAPFFAYIGLIAFIYFIFDNPSKNIRWFLIAVFIICIGFAIINRARTTLLTSLGIITILLFIKYRFHSVLIIPTIAFFSILLFGNVIDVIIQDSIIGHQDINDLNSITSGRTERNAIAMDFINHHPLFGAFEEGHDCYDIWKDSHKVPHNFILWKLVKYGFVLSFPYVFMYFLIAFKILNILRDNLRNNLVVMAGFFISYITSLSEYSAPFGPGTSFILFYILLGRAIYFNNQRHHKTLSS